MYAPCCNHYTHAHLSIQLLASEVSAGYYTSTTSTATTNLYKCSGWNSLWFPLWTFSLLRGPTMLHNDSVSMNMEFCKLTTFEMLQLCLKTNSYCNCWLGVAAHMCWRRLILVRDWTHNLQHMKWVLYSFDHAVGFSIPLSQPTAHHRLVGIFYYNQICES